MCPRNLEKQMILTSVTDLANTLVINGVTKNQPDLVQLGKIILEGINAIEANSEAHLSLNVIIS